MVGIDLETSDAQSSGLCEELFYLKRRAPGSQKPLITQLLGRHVVCLAALVIFGAVYMLYALILELLC